MKPRVYLFAAVLTAILIQSSWATRSGFAQIAHGDVDADQERTVVVYPLKHTDGDSILSVISSVVASEDLRLSYEPRNNSLIVLGIPADHKSIGKLIEVLDVPPLQGSKSEMLEVSVLFIVEKSDSLPELKDPSPKVFRLLEELATHSYVAPFEVPVVGGSVVTRVAVGASEVGQAANGKSETKLTKFHNRSSSAKGILQLLVNGRIAATESGYVWDGSLEVQMKTDSDILQTEIGTQVTLPMDHPVILGFTQIGGVNGVMILEAKQVGK